MAKVSFKANANASMSLVCALRRKENKLKPNFAAEAASFHSITDGVVSDDDRVSLLIESDRAGKILDALPMLRPEERVVPLSDNVVSAYVTLSTAGQLLGNPDIKRMQTKKESQFHADLAGVDAALFPAVGGARAVSETGKGVLIGIVDSGFDLSHPMFRDAAGNLRVEGLLDQTVGTTPVAYDANQLKTGWSNGSNPGRDPHGHGTHVATTAGGSLFQGLEGIAPDARFLLVKTNLRDTADAVQWVFSQAGSEPCVVNMSLGHHFGAHDGTSAEELLIDQLSGEGKIVVISAGNERERDLHIGGQFLPQETQTLSFDVPRPQQGAPRAALTLWYAPTDDFSITLITPQGATFAVPLLGNIDTHSQPSFELEIGRETYAPVNPVSGNVISTSVKVQISIGFNSTFVSDLLLNNWRLRIDCNSATVGRIDGWFANNGFGRFDAHPLLERSRTISMSATARSCLAVASHVSKNAWNNDAGAQTSGLLVGQSSPFSSQGPTRDNRKKPDISAPGQFITAGLAANSQMSNFAERVHTTNRLLTIEGTSMAAPVVSGIVALLLQKEKKLKPDQIRHLLAQSARVDAQVGVSGWNPAFGHGKIDVRKALSLAPSAATPSLTS